MFIQVVYKETPELSLSRQYSDPGLGAEKTLLINPDCHVRVMLEYIRKKCRLGIYTNFDLCDERGGLKGLFNMPTFTYANDRFEHMKTYYIIVLLKSVSDNDKNATILPQLSHDNPLHALLKTRVKQFLLTGHVSPATTPATSPTSKTPPKKKK